MRRVRVQLGLPYSNVGVVFLVHVQVLDQAILDKVLERADALVQLEHVLVRELAPAILDDHKGAAHAAAVTRDKHSALKVVLVRRDELGHVATSAELSETTTAGVRFLMLKRRGRTCEQRCLGCAQCRARDRSRRRYSSAWTRSLGR